MEKGSGVWKRERWKEASLAGDADGVLCEEGKGALVVVVRVLIRVEKAIGACVG